MKHKALYGGVVKVRPSISMEMAALFDSLGRPCQLLVGNESTVGDHLWWPKLRDGGRSLDLESATPQAKRLIV